VNINMLYEFKFYKDGQVSTEIKNEGIKFKPVFYCLSKDFNNVHIYCDGILTWGISKYGSTCYVTRYIEEYVLARYTLEDRKITGIVYVYSKDHLKYILQYKNNNLHGKQFNLDKNYSINVCQGKLEDPIIYFAHSVIRDRLKWS